MKTIKGIYENGLIRLLEAPPKTGINKVLITFIEDDEEVYRGLSFDTSSKVFKSYLEDSGEDLYNEYLNKGNANR